MGGQVVRATLETLDVDEGVAAIREAYPGSQWRAPKDRPFFSAVRLVGDDRLGFLDMDQRATVDSTLPKQDSFIIGAPTQPSLRVAAGRDQLDVTRPFLYPLRELTAAWNEELHLRVTQLDEQTVRDVAAAQYGARPQALRMVGTAPISPQLERYWNIVVAYARQVADDEELFENDLIRHEVLHTLIGAMLRVFPHSLSADAATHDRAGVLTASLRRAIAYMEEHAGDP